MAGFIRNLCALITVSPTWVQAVNFLGVDGGLARSQQVQQQFNNQLITFLGHGTAANSARLERLQYEINSLYAAMPKQIDGGLDRGSVRYALHRFFVQKHGWHVRGLETTGDEQWNDTFTSTAAFEDHIPSYLLELFDKRHGGKTGLGELAMLAATLEDVVHSEAVDLLMTAYDAQGRSVDDKVKGSVAQRIVETYLLFYLMPNPEFAELSVQNLNVIIDEAPHFYTGWLDTLTWVQDLQDAIQFDESSQRNPFTDKKTKAQRKHEFNSIVRLVETLGEKYGQYQNLECRGLKNALLDLSDGSGRVRLAKFYKAAFEGEQSHFSESPDYLRHLGALDETDPQQPAVIMTNYMYARANCMASSGLYSICCIDECENLMARLEKSIVNPVADPETLVEFVSGMPSETVAAPRNISVPMKRRLEDIAQRHGGRVPLHGRLFAQWMHHAFPNECRYPHVTGSLEAPLTTLEWLEAEQATGRLLKASMTEMQAFIDAASPSNASDPIGESHDLVSVPWSEEEELAVAIPIMSAHPLGEAGWWIRLVALSVATISAVVGFLRTLTAARRTLAPVLGDEQKLASHWV